MDIKILLIGFCVGCLITYAILNFLNSTKRVSKKDFDDLSAKNNELITSFRLFEDKAQTLQKAFDHSSEKLSSKETEIIQLQIKATSLDENRKNNERNINDLSQKLSAELVINKSFQDEINLHKQKISELTANNNSITENLSKQIAINDKLTKQIEELIGKNTELTAQASRIDAINSALNDKLTTQKAQVEELQRTAHLQFEKIANRLLEEKTEKFTATNKINIESLLIPFKEDIHKFKEKVEATHTEETKQRTALEERIKSLIEQTNKVSNEANNLASALKGKAQKRGNWGEMILEGMLEASGLTKDREYFIQHLIKDDEGKTQRPDVKVMLPDDRLIIIDSKVSLIAYDNYCKSEDGDEQKRFLTEHINATKLHIEQLSEKKYDDTNSSLDFTMMFIPIEPAYLLAIQGDGDLWSYAYSKRILLVSPTTLIACLKLFSDLWRREWQNKNAMEIVKKGEALYEKFVGFTKTFEEVGNSLKSSQEKYDKAMGQLKDGKGNLISHATQLKNLGLKSDKKFSLNMLPLSTDETVD